MDTIPIPDNINYKMVWAMFQDVAQRFKETDKQFKETDQKFQDTDQAFKDTDRRFKETDRKFREIQQEIGGIGKSNGEIAEDFFYSALEHSMRLGKLQFDYIDRNTHRKRKNIEAEYDIILYNNYKVLIVEVKYNFRIKQLRRFYTDKLKVFRTLYPQYKEFILYGAIAALTFDKDVIEEAQNFGFYILSQNNDKMKLLNSNDFAPNEIK